MISGIKPTLLLIGSSDDFHRLVGQAFEDAHELLHASDRKDGLAKAQKARPDAIILGPIEPSSSLPALYSTLRDGWITKHIPLLVADSGDNGTSRNEPLDRESIGIDSLDYFFTQKLGDFGQPTGPAAALFDRVAQKLVDRQNRFRTATQSDREFCVTWEQIPGRGAFEKQQDAVFRNVADAAAGGKVHALSVTDNPGGNPAIATEMLSAEIKRAGIEPLVHLACRDKNRNELESLLYGLAAADVRNVLILSGDYPSGQAFGGRPKPVFDIDPVQTLQMVSEMNRGLEHTPIKKKVTLASTELFAGACASPFKTLEEEQIPQYYKIQKKIEAGAEFLITQVGYDARRYQELMLWLESIGSSVPVLMNIYVLSRGAAKLMQSGAIPGCAVSEGLLEKISEEAKAEDKGKQARIDRAVEMFAIGRGMGFAGAHIGGHGIGYGVVEEIVDRGNELAENWRDLLPRFDLPETGTFYFFEKDGGTGLNTKTPTSLAAKRRIPLVYRISRLAHIVLFNPKSIVFKMFRPFARFIDRHPRMSRAFGFMEHVGKTVMFDCQNCGDCALFDVAFLCPMSQCPKQQRNGPCGGSKDGWCEVYPGERLCVWVRAYGRLKRYGESESIGEYIVPPCNWDFMHTSSWLNFYLGQDHSAVRLGIKPVGQIERGD